MPVPTTWRDEFPTLDRSVYLNTCSLGALSRTSRRYLADFQDEWEVRGAAAWYDTWWQRLADLRLAYAGLIGANAGTVALHPSISTATAVLASTIDYRQRPRVVTTSLDFPTVSYQWLARQPEVEVVVVESPDGVGVPVEAIAAQVDERTALVATSHVWFTTGVRQDIAAIAAVAHRQGARCYVDGYQAAGQIPVDVRAAGVDFYSGGGLKWLLGGPGIAFLYARDDLLSSLEPVATGWFAHENQFGFDPRVLTRHADARRLEQGTPAMAAVHAQLGGLAVLQTAGLATVFDRTAALTRELLDGARARGLNPRCARDVRDQTAIVTLPHADPSAVVRRLADRGIIVDARPGHVRVSPFFYNSSHDIEKFLQAF